MPRGEAMEKGKREETNHCGASINHVAPCIILCRASNLAEELASLLTVFEPIARKEARLNNASSCTCTQRRPSTNW